MPQDGLGLRFDLSRSVPDFLREALERAEHGELDDAGQETAEALVDLGVDPAEATAAVLEGRVHLVLAKQALGNTAKYSVEKIAEKGGISVELFEATRLAAGLPLADRYTRLDLELAKRIGGFLDVIPPEAMVASARARGQAIATVVRSDLGTMRNEIVVPMRRAGADDLTVSVALAEATKEFYETSREILDLTYALHLENVLSSELAAIATRDAATEVEVAVGFVDVVGYTALSSRVDPAGLDELLDAFQARLIEVASAHEEVAIVKWLGDAGMFVAPSASRLAVAMLDAVTEVDVLADAPLRGGMAAGPVLIRDADYFGPPVNMAARLTDLARPWSLLADEALIGDLGDDVSVDKIRPVRIRGVGVRRPLAVHPA